MGDAAESQQVRRRDVLRVAAVGLTASVGLVRLGGEARADTVDVELYVNAGMRSMVDGRSVFVVGFGSRPDSVELPGGVIEVETGDEVRVSVSNNTSQPHSFVVRRFVDSGGIAPGDTRTVVFTAPRPGTYFYTDGLRDPVNRSLGLYGALVVLPRGDHSRPVPLPPGVRIPGGTRVVQEYTWVLSDYDPRWGELARRDRRIDRGSYEPRYFFINGLSGVLAAEDPNTKITGRVGDRTLLRMVNVGLAPRSIHLHGNHFRVLTHPDAPWLIGAAKDTVRIPAASCVDALIPYEAPPDAFPPVRHGQKYPVHDHIEMAQTANGGLNPSGMISEFAFV